MEGGFVTDTFVKQAPSMWTNFVAAIRKLLGLDTKYGSALLDLVTLTEQLLVSEEGRRAEKGIDGGVLSRRLTAEFKLYELLGIQSPQRAYHGGATFEKFDLRYASGTRGMAQGWGLYFSKLSDLADSFRKAQADSIDRAVEGLKTKISSIKNQLAGVGLRPREALTELQRNTLKEELKNAEFELDYYQKADRGSLYQVDIPEDTELMDMDELIINQPKEIQDKVRSVFERYMPGEIASITNTGKEGGPYARGLTFYEALKSKVGGWPEAAKILSDAGLKGGKYKALAFTGKTLKEDRWADAFVIWDADAVTIEAVNGQQQAAGRAVIRDAARTAKKAAAEDKVYKRVSDAVENVKRSERATGADRNAIGLLADAMMNFVRGTSSADYIARVFRTIKDNIPSRMIPTFLGFMDSNDITRMYGTELPVLKEVRKMLDHMGAYQTKRLQEVEKVVIDWGELTTRHPEASKFLNRLLAITTKFDVDVLRNKTYAEALQNDEELKLLQAAVAKDPNNSAAKREMNERMQELKIVYQGYTDPDGYEIVGWDRLNTMANGWASRVGRKSLEAYEEAREEYFKLLKKNLEDSMLPEEGKQQVLAQINEMMAEARKRPGYSPLQRFGQYWVRIGKRTDAQFIMFESPVQRDLYVQEYLQGKDMEALAAAGEIAIGDNTNEMREYMRLNSDMLKDMFSAIDNLSGNLVNTAGMDVATATKATADAAQELKNVVYDFYLRTLPEQDIRRRFTRRKGTAGYSTDFLRVFATQMFSTSNQLGRLKFQQPVYAALSGAKDNLQGRVDKRARRLRSVLNEFTLRANSEVTSAPQTPWDQFASLATKGTFFYLLSSPRSALIQFSQVPNVGFPVLVSKGYGTGNIAKKFAKYLNVFQTLRLPEQEVDGSFEVKVGTPVMVTSPAVRNDPVLQWAWNYADRSNVFMSTYTGALWGRTRTSSERYTDPSKRAGRMVGTLMTGLFHSTEHLSRQFMFMVSFELELDRLVKKGIPREEAKYAAAEAAEDITWEALLDYGQFNKARYLKKPLLRVGTQFYSYGIQMMSLLTRSAYKMIKGIGDAEAQQIKQDLLEKGLGEVEATRQARKLALERTKEIRREAAIQFWGISLTTGITAGVTGLPMYYLIVGLMEALRAAGWEDDEDPFLDPATKKRIPIDALWRYYSIPRLGGDISQALGLSDEWGKKVSDLIKYGAPSAITGLDMSNPISLSNLLMLGSPQADSTRDFLTQATFRLLGPAGASIDSIGRGIEEIFVNGDSRGWEKLSPALFRGGPRAYRLATEGEITPTQRDVVLAKDQFTLGLLVGQSIGFNPLDLVDLKARNYEALKLQRQVKKEKAEILDELNRAYVYYVSDPDNEGYKERYIDALRAVEGYNLEFYNFKDPITTDTIQKSLTGRAKSRAEAIQGAPLEAGYREALMPLFLPTLPKE